MCSDSPNYGLAAAETRVDCVRRTETLWRCENRRTETLSRLEKSGSACARELVRPSAGPYRSVHRRRPGILSTVHDPSYLGTKAPQMDAGRDSAAALVRRCGIDPQPVLRSPESTSSGPADDRRIHSQAT